MFNKSMMHSILTLLIGVSGAMLLNTFHLPLASVLGSMLATALASMLGLHLTLSKHWKLLALALIGIILGESLHIDYLIDHFIPWLTTISAMAVLTFVYLFVSYVVLYRYANMDKVTAFFSAIPGGLSMVSVLADQYKADTKRVAISHSARIVVLLTLTPIALKLFGGIDLSLSVQSNPLSWQGLLPSALETLILISCTLLAIYIANKVKLPIAILIIAIALSTFVYSVELVQTLVPTPIIFLTQVIIGSSVGIRFSGYKPKEIFIDGWISIVLGVILSTLAVLGALLLNQLLGYPFGPAFLVLLPGGAPEIGVISIALNIDPNMVVIHHLLRVFLIILTLDVMILLLRKRLKK